MTLDELLDEWAEDGEFGIDMARESTRVPVLHNRYYRRYIKIKGQLRELREQYETLEMKKTLYYTGRDTPEAYKAKPFEFKVTSRELPMWLAADDDLKKLRKRIGSAEDMLEALSEIVGQINKRNFLIKSINDARVFQAGGL